VAGLLNNGRPENRCQRLWPSFPPRDPFPANAVSGQHPDGRTLESGAGPTIYAPAIGFVDGDIS
jgi:hypothetical protein